MKVEPGAEPEDVTPAGFNVRTDGARVRRRSALHPRRRRLLLQLRRPAPLPPRIPERRRRRSLRRIDEQASPLRRRLRDDRRLALDRSPRAPRRRRPGGRDQRARGSPDRRVRASRGSSPAAATSTPPHASRRTGDGSPFLAWDLPWMPWDGCELFVADLSPDRELGETVHVAGRDGEESIWQPEWSPDGDLVFASDRSGWWNFERVRDGERQLLHPAEAEFGYPAWAFAMRSYDFLGDGRIACSYDSDGRTAFGILDPEAGELTISTCRTTPRARRDRRRGRARSSSSRAPRPSRTSSFASTRRPAPTTSSARARRRTSTPPGSRCRRRSSSRRRTTSPPTRSVLPAEEPDLRRRRRRGAAAHRHVPRWADGEDHERSSPSRCSTGRRAASPWWTSTTAARPGTAAPIASG